MTDSKLIKAIHTSKYSVELFLTPSDQYIIQRSKTAYGLNVLSEPMRDFGVASMVFDVTVEELEGN